METSLYTRLLESVNILDVFEHYGFELKRAGREYITRCPFHNDHRPSMRVVPDKNFCICFACSTEALKPLQFLKKYNNVDGSTALEIMAQIGNVCIDANPRDSVPVRTYAPRPRKLDTSYTDMKLVDSSSRESAWGNNPLFQFLASLYDEGIVRKVFQEYRIGTSKHKVNPSQKSRNSVVFWQIDVEGRVRGGKIMPYDETTGKRIKHPCAPDVAWVHKVVAEQRGNYNLRQCLFGEHLLRGEADVINIVESQKTAVIQRIRNYVSAPTSLWLSSGGKGAKNLISDSLDVIGEWPIVLWPDADGYAEWMEIADNLKKRHINVSVDDTLVKAGIGAETKKDIADFAIELALQQRGKPKERIEDKKAMEPLKYPPETCLKWLRALDALHDIVPNARLQLGWQDMDIAMALQQYEQRGE